VKPGGRGHPVFAWIYDRVAGYEERHGLSELRQEVLRDARGRVVELGAGTGLNFPRYPATVDEVVATEPDPHMLRRAARAAEKARVPITTKRAGAEELPFEDDSIDTVVATFVLCTVPDPAAALAEAKRVLKPCGALVFLEHVRAEDPKLARWQDRIRGPWGFFAAGCHPNRDTPASIERAGFELERIDRFPFAPAMPLIRPHAMGVARKPA